LSRNAGDPDKERYSAYVLESAIVLDSGMLLPLLTETLDNGDKLDGNGKQDCETKAFQRLARRLAKLLGSGCVTILADGLYATGPMISLCQSYGWEFMITLKRESLKSVWEDFDGLRKIEPENALEAQWGGRQQGYRWSNGIEYTYGGNHKKLLLNVVTCTETWDEPHPRKNKPCQKRTEYAWLSSSAVTADNVFALCTKAARSRWRIENGFLVAKHQGYGFSHCFSYDWNAMKGFHCLMKFAAFINAFITNSIDMEEYIVVEGIQGTVKKAWQYLLVIGLPEDDAKWEPWGVQYRNKRQTIRFRDIKLKQPA
jgi:hypothetical protein